MTGFKNKAKFLKCVLSARNNIKPSHQLLTKHPLFCLLLAKCHYSFAMIDLK